MKIMKYFYHSLHSLIRCFDIKYLTDILDLYKQNFDTKVEMDIDNLKNLIINKYYKVCFCLNNNSKVVGIIILAVLSENKYHIEYLCVDKNFTSLGIGKMLINFIKDILPLNNILSLHCEEKMINYYKKLGFTLLLDLFSFQNITFYTMIKGEKNVSAVKIINELNENYWKCDSHLISLNHE